MNDYRVGHTAPEDDGYSAPLPAAQDRFGPDILDQPDLYGSCDDETLRQLAAAVHNPEAVVRIYRAVPPEHLEINRGDWVTLSRAYAHDHGYVGGGADWPVVFADVLATEVWTDGNDPSEYGYGGTNLTGLVGYAETDAMPAQAAVAPAGLPAEESVHFTSLRGALEERRQPPTADTTTRSPDRSNRP